MPDLTVTERQYHGSALWQAIDEIYATYGDRVSVVDKKKSLLKFGRSSQVQTTNSTLMTLPTGTFNETYVSDNSITHMASGSTDDTTQTLTIEGHTISGNNLTFVVQTKALAGQTKTALTTPLARITRAYVSTGSTNLTGPIYFAEDVTFTTGVPQTDSAVHMIIPAGKNQTEKASTSVSSTDYWIVTGVYGDVLSKTAAFAIVSLETREIGKVFRERFVLSASNSTRGFERFDPYFIIPKNHDARLVASANANGTDVSGGIQGYLAKVI